MSQQFLPLLKPENIDQLKTLILQIMQDNDAKIQKIIEARQSEKLSQGDSFTIEDLNDILAEQCLQKQKIVSNLSHFSCTSLIISVSLMNTIQVLWQDNEDLQYKIKDQREIVEQINNHLHEINKQNQFYKNKLYLAYNDFHKIQQEKQALQEYINSVFTHHEKSFDDKGGNKIFQNPQDKKNILNQELMLDEKNNSIRKLSMDEQSQDDNSQNLQSNLINQTDNYEKSIENQRIGDLLQQSVIKDSISILKRFTLEQDCQNKLQQLEGSQSQIKFIEKNNRFSLMREISVQIFQEQKKIQEDKDNKVIKIIDQERSTLKDLTFSNQKINITIGTGTQVSKTKNSDQNLPLSFSMIHENPSCDSFILNRQHSAIMYPSFERSSSSLSFVTHTTKQIQTDLDKYKEPLKKNFKKVESNSIAVDTRQMQNPYKKTNKPKIQSKKQETSQQPSIIEQNSQRKSFSQLLSYFTKKIVSDRIRTNVKKNDFSGFKKTKSNIQKVF